MLSPAVWILQWARKHMGRMFQQFGIHCATHQIRIIVISSLVITSLFYPALALYSPSSPTSVSILDTFFSPKTPDVAQDLVDVWTGHKSLRTETDSVSRLSCGVGRVLRVERILVQSPLEEDSGPINEDILSKTLSLEQRIDELLASHRLPCLQGPDGRCFVLSPLAFWNHDREVLSSDQNVLDTLIYTQNISIAGIHVTPHMVLADRHSNEAHGSKEFDSAMFLALTYFFTPSVCSGNGERVLWQQLVREATEGADLIFQPQEPTLIALEYESSLSKQKGTSAISAFLYLAYLSFFAYVSWSMRRMKSVHSRIGLTFTALVEIAVSTITSLSVCALVGFKVTMVPWEMLPIMIVFVGAENMFNLVDAVSKTSITLSVKQRISEGLSRAGTSNTLKVVSYNSILGVIAVFATGAIRQFCVFAIVVLVAHWFLAHTFFMAVLSIDLQRLELEELLRQNSYLTPPVPQEKADAPPAKSSSPWQSLLSFARSLLSGRATKNLSLVLLLAITSILYYATMPSESASDTTGTFFRPAVKSTVKAGSDQAAKIWKTLNPHQVTLHLRVEAPAIVTFQSDIKGIQHRPRFSMRTFRMILWLLKIMVLPITATTVALWGLMLYLLKNADLLEAQKNKPAEGSQAKDDEETSLDGKISFSTLPRVFDSDVELIATSRDGQVVISVGLQNEIVIWHVGKQSHIEIDSTDVLLRTASSSSANSALTCVSVDDRGEYCAVGTGSGVVAVWAILNDGVRPLPHFAMSRSSAVVALQFTAGPASPHPPTFSNPSSPKEPPYLVAIYENGAACKWSVQDIPTFTLLAPTRETSIIKSSILRGSPDENLVVAFYMESGTLELVEVEDRPRLLAMDYCIQAGNPTDIVTNVHLCRTSVRGENRTVVAAATEAGVVSLWDGQTGSLITVMDEAYGRINRLYVSAVRQETCHYCGHLPLDSFAVTFSVDQQVWFFKAYLPDETQRCTCTPTRARRVPSFDSLPRRSRNNSIASSVGSSPLMSRTRPLITSETSPFPVSGHGGRLHSRRASEKEARARLSEQTLSLPGDDADSGHFLGPPDTRPNSPPTVWSRLQVVRMADITCERGGWDAIDGKVVGIRRRPRPEAKPPGKMRNPISFHSNGLSVSTLDRWEIWTFDPSLTRLQSSALSSLVETSEESSRSSSSDSDSVAGNGHCSRSLAGFGNTLGVFNFS